MSVDHLAALEALISEQAQKGLLDVKFCINGDAVSNSSSQAAAEDVLSILRAHKEGRTTAYTDF